MPNNAIMEFVILEDFLHLALITSNFKFNGSFHSIIGLADPTTSQFPKGRYNVWVPVERGFACCMASDGMYYGSYVATQNINTGETPGIWKTGDMIGIELKITQKYQGKVSAWSVQFYHNLSPVGPLRSFTTGGHIHAVKKLHVVACLFGPNEKIVITKVKSLESAKTKRFDGIGVVEEIKENKCIII